MYPPSLQAGELPPSEPEPLAKPFLNQGEALSEVQSWLKLHRSRNWQEICWVLVGRSETAPDQVAVLTSGSRGLEALPAQLFRQPFAFVAVLVPADPFKTVLIRYAAAADPSAAREWFATHTPAMAQIGPFDATLGATSLSQVSEENIRRVLHLPSNAEEDVLRAENLVYAPRRASSSSGSPNGTKTLQNGHTSPINGTASPINGITAPTNGVPARFPVAFATPVSPTLPAKHPSNKIAVSGNNIASSPVPQPTGRSRSPVKRPQSVPLEDREIPSWPSSVKCWKCGAGNLPVETLQDSPKRTFRSKSVPPSRSYVSENVKFLKQHVSERWRDVKKIEELETRNMELAKELEDRTASLQALNMHLFRQMQSEKQVLMQQLADERAAKDKALAQLVTSGTLVAKLEADAKAATLALTRELELKRQLEEQLTVTAFEFQASQRENNQLRSMVNLEKTANETARGQINQLNRTIKDMHISLQNARSVAEAAQAVQSRSYQNFPLGPSQNLLSQAHNFGQSSSQSAFQFGQSTQGAFPSSTPAPSAFPLGGQPTQSAFSLGGQAGQTSFTLGQSTQGAMPLGGQAAQSQSQLGQSALGSSAIGQSQLAQSTLNSPIGQAPQNPFGLGGQSAQSALPQQTQNYPFAQYTPFGP
eukprot:TRINITY_DN5707_c0_g1_i3.p1 TRINITY_DN5707_c0_g1~~TRINITY_DN5707_c0_g1_i3.p1  ORF type:complete len:711 (+),score=167.41 TRINITY_DN5707_c0_g1_i3:191-2134(+)